MAAATSIVVGVVPGVAGTAGAQEAPAPPPAFELSPEHGTAGTEVTAASVDSCAAGAVATVSTYSAPEPDGVELADPVTATADDDGAWTATIVVPLDAPA